MAIKDLQDVMKEDAVTLISSEIDEDVKTCIHGNVRVTFSAREYPVCPLCVEKRKSVVLMNAIDMIGMSVTRSTEILKNATR